LQPLVRESVGLPQVLFIIGASRLATHTMVVVWVVTGSFGTPRKFSSRWPRTSLSPSLCWEAAQPRDRTTPVARPHVVVLVDVLHPQPHPHSPCHPWHGRICAADALEKATAGASCGGTVVHADQR
jgi:hypothetical protein